MPGFPDHRQFVLVRVTEEGVLYALTSVDEPELRFLVVPPAPFFPDYAPEIDDESLAALGATDADAEGLMILLVVTAGDTAGLVDRQPDGADRGARGEPAGRASWSSAGAVAGPRGPHACGINRVLYAYRPDRGDHPKGSARARADPPPR